MRKAPAKVRMRGSERCRSGRTGLTRNQVYASCVPWVRIPPSPPNRKAPQSGAFLFGEWGGAPNPPGFDNSAGQRNWTSRRLAPQGCGPRTARINPTLCRVPSSDDLKRCAHATTHPGSCAPSLARTLRAPPEGACQWAVLPIGRPAGWDSPQGCRKAARDRSPESIPPALAFRPRTTPNGGPAERP